MPVEGSCRLSIVVIGRNEAPHLARLFRSVKPVAEAVPSELIYVDSASDDDSRELAARHGARVVQLEASEHLSASAGRFVGTLVANGEWVLYLDGDMELCREFAEFVPLQVAEGRTDGRACGFVGRYDNVYPDGTRRLDILRQKTSRRDLRRILGGALLVSRDAVLDAGNWDPRLSGWEEMELYTRLLRGGYRLRPVDRPMVIHYTEWLPLGVRVLNLLCPLNRRYWAFGHVLRARASSRTLPSFVRYFPYPFIYWGLLSTAAIVGLGFGAWAATIILAAAAVLYVCVSAGPKFLITYLLFLPQMIGGMLNYPKDWSPASRWVSRYVD